MIIFCKHCGQKYDIDESYIGQLVECESCHKDFEVKDTKKVTECPDCGKIVSKRAESCPHCGAPINKSTLISNHNIKNNANYSVAHNISMPGKDVIIGLIPIVIGIVAIGLSRTNLGEFSLLIGILPVPAILIGILLLTRKYIKCDRCNYTGHPVEYSGPNGCATVLLLLLGVLPGIIYYFACRKRYRCPSCGAEVL